MSASKAKGTAAETAVVRFLQANGYPHAERRALAGRFDHGDVAGLPVVIEVKNAQRMELAAWLDEASAETIGTGTDKFVVWHKRRGMTDPGEWYVTMDGYSFIEFLREWADAQRADVV